MVPFLVPVRHAKRIARGILGRVSAASLGHFGNDSDVDIDLTVTPTPEAATVSSRTALRVPGAQGIKVRSDYATKSDVLVESARSMVESVNAMSENVNKKCHIQ